MLSTENPPPDLCEISKLKSVSSDERTSGFNQQHLFEVDLFNSGLDDNNPLPKFSIRDYVFNTRGKDIKNNWPFSHKSLQLCVKHGVKDVLPPFQPLDSVRNQSILTDSDVKLSDQSVVVVNTEKLKSSDKSEEDTEFPSTTTSQSCSDINSLLPITSPCLEPPEKPDFTGRGPNKVDSSPVKKCRLIVKLTNISEPKSNEESAAVVSESMASKVCPVCKTFSSSSNTTLNAHIDQCLSVESSVKWTPNSKVVKHRIKPRKTKLMVDIYETALPCTLEDLDKRNGTNWCSNRGPPPDQDLEECSEEEEKMYHSVNVEDNNQDGAVYIDSNGTKLRILSKLSNPPSKSNADDDPGPSKFVKRGDVGRKVLLSKKRKIFVQKHKPQKPSLDGQGSCSPLSDHHFDCLPHGPISYNGLEAENGQQKLLHSEGCKEDDTAQHLVVSDQMKPEDFGMIKQWVGSKRTGIKKKINVERGNQHTDRSTKNLRVKSVSSVGDAFSKGSAASTSPISSDENPCLPPESHKRKDTLCSSHDGFIGASSLRKRPPFPLSTFQHSRDKKNDLMFSKFKPGKDLPSAHESHMDPPNGTENHVSSRSDKKMGMCGNPSFLHHHRISSEGKKFASPRKSSSGHTISAGGKKLSSLRTALLSFRHTSVTEPKRNFARKLKKTRLHCSSQSNEEEFVVSRSAVRRQNSMVETMGGSATQLEKDSDKSLMNRTRVLKLQKKVGERDKDLESSPESDSLSGGENVDSFTGNDDPIGVEQEAEMLDELVREPAYGMTDGEAFESFSKSLDSAFPGLADSSNIECGSHYYSGRCPDELVLNGDQDNVVAEMDTDEVQGNYFVDVDPIPIPGPPGSFLPSPGRMGSEELQGHSSLTTCRLQSSEEGHEVVDMDSSDSPISAMSVVSNSVTGRGASISITNLSAPSQLDISVDHRTAPAVESYSPFEQVGSGDRELNLLESRPALISAGSTHEVRNVQLCCCARKDGSLQGNHHQDQSQVIRRRTMTSPVVTSNDPKNEIHCLYMGSGTTLPEKEAASEPAASLQMVYPLRSCETKFQTSFGDSPSPSPSPSTPNPVLRLMGKNLMVVNKDESSSPLAMPFQSSMVMDHPSPRTSACNNQKERSSSFHHSLPRGPSTFDNLQQQHFDHSHGFKIPANYRPSQLSTHPSTPVFPPSMNFVDARCHGFASGFNLVADQLIRLEPRPAAETCVHHMDSFGGTHEEIIMIDESEAGLGVKTEGGGGANPFYSYQTRVYPHFNGPPNGNTPANKWNNCIPQGSTALHSNSSTPTGVHLRSPSLYFSPCFSFREHEI